MLADAAEVVGGKLYLLGGGWDRLTVNDRFPHTRAVAVALALEVPWDETNQRHQITVTIETLDHEQLAQLGAEFECGRPPGIPQGHPQLVQLAATIPVTLAAPGSYLVVARGPELEERTPFIVVAGSATRQTAA
jgi:hypothetical protein